MKGPSAKIGGVTPVAFSHWVHRAKYTCRVCHGELEFSMKANDTGVVCDNGEAKNRYCTVCHNGKIAFATKDEEGDNCKRCHNADQSPNEEKFFALQKSLPRAKFGNEIDWVKALDNGSIKPKGSLSGGSQPIGLDKTLTLGCTAYLQPSFPIRHMYNGSIAPIVIQTYLISRKRPPSIFRCHASWMENFAGSVTFVLLFP